MSRKELYVSNEESSSLEKATFSMTVDFKLREQLRNIFTSEEFQKLRIDRINCNKIQPSIHVWKLMKVIEKNFDLFPSDCTRLFTEEKPDRTIIGKWANKFKLPKNLLITYYETASEILLHFVKHKEFLNFNLLFKTCTKDNSGSKSSSLCEYLKILRSMENTQAGSIENTFAKDLFKNITIENTFSGSLIKYQENLDEITEYYNESNRTPEQTILLHENINTRLLITLLSTNYSKIQYNIDEILGNMAKSGLQIRPLDVAEYIRSNSEYIMMDLANVDKKNMSFNVTHSIIQKNLSSEDLSKDMHSSFINDKNENSSKLDSSLNESLRQFTLSNIDEINHKSSQIGKTEKIHNNENQIIEKVPKQRKSKKSNSSNPKSFEKNDKNRSVFTSSKKLNSNNRVMNIHSPPQFHQYHETSPFCRHCGIPHLKGQHLFSDIKPFKLNESLYLEYRKVLHKYKPQAYEEAIRKFEQENGYSTHESDYSNQSNLDDSEDSDFDAYDDFYQ